MKRILIEFFDEENLNNCISQLFYNYDEIYYFYFPSQKKIYGIAPVFDALEKFNEKKLKVTPVFIRLRSEDPGEITSAIAKTVENADSVDFDITGGPESFSYAVGRYVSDNKPGNVRVQY